MYLKTLELQGFKSFADKTKIELGGGIAAIVGPNGSGKSNIVEAIQWVLGEQSAKTLRGHKMQDIIFNGTKNRKPLGVAEISIVLDNSDHSLDIDFTEVKVTRRLYRSGEGEYLINGKNVRLKDVRRLFADSGIGSDGYAVIGQGRIVEIIDSRPEDRRAIVEETAGIVKYRERKKEAQRKIDNADQNLLRLMDIMTEIEGRLGPLATDAENAEKYLTFAKERDQLAIGMLGETLQDTGEKLIAVEKEEAQAGAAQERLFATVMAKEAKIAEEKASLVLENDNYHKREQEYHSLKLEIEKSEGELKSLNSRLSGSQDKQKLLSDTITAENDRAEQLAEEITSFETEDLRLRERLHELRSSLNAMESQRKSAAADLLKAESEMENMRNQAFESTRACAMKKNERIAVVQRMESLEKRVQAISEKSLHYEDENSVLDHRMAEITANMDDLMTEKDALDQKKSGIDREHENLKAKLREHRESLVDLKMRISRGEARLKVLEELTLKREGFYPGVRAVLERKSKGGCEGIYGVVAELIRVDKAYTVAIESVLGSALQNIVTETGEDASDAVAYLKSQRKGIATFLPLDLLRINERRKIPQDISEHPGYRGNAADMVSAPQRVKPAVEYLLGNTLIFEKLSDAVAVTRRHKGQFRMVSMDGDVIQAGGTVSGGSREKSKNSFLQRQNEVEELRRFLLNGERRTEEINGYIDDANEQLQRLNDDYEKIEAKQEHLTKELSAFDNEINTIDARRELFEKEQEVLNGENDQLLTERSLLTKTLTRIDEEIAAAEGEEQRLLAEITQREDAFKHAKSSENKDRDAFTELQVSFAEAKSAYEHNRNLLERGRLDLDELQRQSAEKQREHAAATEEYSRINGRRQELSESLMQRNRELLIFADALSAEKNQRDAHSASLEKEEQALKALQKEESAAKEKVYQLSLRKERYQVEMEQCEGQLREEYHMVLADAIPYINREQTKKEKRDRVKMLKQQIAALGSVNIGAIEEYQAVSERYDFLKDQRNDVLEAKASLENIVAEMDDIIVKRFQSTFQEINESFQKTFPAFFHGGHGELQLTDGEDLLHCGVDIVVQPPGKRLQHLSLLSGGEKSLSGIALLFAILKVKPSPFYVLDEIDAALDDANVRRFGDYLTKYGVDSQFLVITHRQGTMESAETMYGVTMAEEGVSQTVSVKLV